MKIYRVLLVVIILAGNGAIYGANKVVPNEYGKNHICRVNKNKQIILVKNGKSNVEIVTGENASSVVKFAAKELQKYLNKSTGADIKIREKSSGKVPAIMLGVNEITKPFISKELEKLPVDGFVIKKPEGINAVIIAGVDKPGKDVNRILSKSFTYWNLFQEKATLYGVYDFLERFAGIRFYFPGEIGTVVPKNKTLKVPEMHIIECPDFPARRTGIAGKWDKEMGPEKNKLLQLLRYRMESFHIPHTHGLTRINLIERFGKTHPEYFALDSHGNRDCSSNKKHCGQLCFKNKGLQEVVYEDVKAYMTGEKSSSRNIRNWDPMVSGEDRNGTRYFNIMQQDGLGSGNACHCEKCIKYLKPDNKLGELIWEFIAGIAKKMKKNNIPGIITTMAYSITSGVPKMDIPDNVIVMLATTGPWVENDKMLRERGYKQIEDWNRKLYPRKVWIWTYMYKQKRNGIPGIPNSTPFCVGHYYKKVAPYIDGALLGTITDYWIFNYLNFYIFYRMAWDSSRNVEDIMREHNQKMFGAAAVPMGKFLKKIEELWLKCNGGFVQTPLGPTPVVPSEMKIWSHIYTENVMNELNSYCSKAENLAADDPESIARIKFIRRNFLDRIQARRKKYTASQKKLDELIFEVLPKPAGKLNWTKDSSLNLMGYKNSQASEKTTVYAFWDINSLYLFFKCFDSKMADALYSSKKTKENTKLYLGTSVEIFLSPGHKRKTYYQIIISPAGNSADLKAVINDNGTKNIDFKWNSNAEVKTTVDSKGWTAFVKIPLKSIGLEKGRKNIDIVANFARTRVMKNNIPQDNQFVWSPFIRNGYGDILNFGIIRLVDKKSTKQNLLKNGDFEESYSSYSFPKFWYAYPKSKKGCDFARLDEKVFCSGSHSLMLSNSSRKMIFVGQGVKLEPESKYLLTFFLKTKDLVPTQKSSRNGACISFLDKGKQVFYPKSGGYLGTIPWTKQGVSFETGWKGISTIRLRLLNASGTVWFDNVQLHRVNKK